MARKPGVRTGHGNDRTESPRPNREEQSRERFKNARRDQLERRRKIMELRRLKKLEDDKKRREELQRKIEAQQKAASAAREKNKDLRDKHQGESRQIDSELRHERVVEEVAQSRRANEAPAGEPEVPAGRGLSGVRPKQQQVIDDLDWESSTKAPSAYKDAVNISNNDPEGKDLWMVVLDGKGRRQLIKPSMNEITRWADPRRNDPVVGSARFDKDGKPLSAGAADEGTASQPNPILRGSLGSKGFQFVEMVGGKGPLLVSNEGVTTVAPGGKVVTKRRAKQHLDSDPEGGFHSRTTKKGKEYGSLAPADFMGDAPTFTTQGQYMTVREQKDAIAKLATADPAAYTAWQEKLAKAGYYDDDVDPGKPVISGVYDRETRQAMNRFFYDAALDGPVTGRDFDDLLRDKAIYVAELSAANSSGGGGGGGGGGATSYSATDPATLKLYAEDAAKTVTGRIATPQEIAEAVAQVQAAEAAEGAKTSGAIVSVDPQAVMTEFFRKKAPDESGAKNMADAFESFASMLGAGGAIGQGGGGINLGNPKIGA